MACTQNCPSWRRGDGETGRWAWPISRSSPLVIHPSGPWLRSSAWLQEVLQAPVSMGQGWAAPRGLSWGPQATGTSPRCRWEGAPATPSPAPGPAPLFPYSAPFPLGHLYSLLICSSVFFAVSCIANTFCLLWLIMGFQPIAWINLIVKDALPVLHWSQERHWKHPSPVSTSEQTGPLPQHVHLNIMKCD